MPDKRIAEPKKAGMSAVTLWVPLKKYAPIPMASRMSPKIIASVGMGGRFAFAMAERKRESATNPELRGPIDPRILAK